MSSLLTPVLPSVLPSEPIARLTVDQYHSMIDADILSDEDPVELLEGWLVPRMPKNPPHHVATLLTRQALEKLVPSGWYVDSQEPITLTESEPEPDVCVIRGVVRDFVDRHPGPLEIALVVEVAETTLTRDRGIKKRIYARAGVPIYWIINLVDRVVEVYADPTGTAEMPDFRQTLIFSPGETIPFFLEGREIGKIEVEAILP